MGLPLLGVGKGGGLGSPQRLLGTFVRTKVPRPWVREPALHPVARALYSYNAETREKEFVDTYGSFEHDARYSDNIVENAYVDEITNFFGVLAGREQPRWSFEKDKEAIALIERIEGA